MIPLLRFLLRLQPFVELGFIAERSAINPLKLWILFIASVVRGCHAKQLERFHIACAHHMRART